MELLLRRDRAGCYVCMDEVLIFETTSFDIFCEKERWASGHLVLKLDALKARRWTLELKPSGTALAVSSVSASPSKVGVGRDDLTVSPLFDDAFFDPSNCQLALELCLVGTCGGHHECMTGETSLQTWKVASPRSFVQQPTLGAIAEMCADEWSDDEGNTSRCAAAGRDREDAGSDGADSSPESAEKSGSDGGDEASISWNIVRWKGERSLFDRAEVLRNVRKRYEDLMHEYHSTSESAAEDLFKGEMTWFSAGMRIGVGVGLGVCLGLGLGVGILVNGYKVSRDRLSNIQKSFRYHP